MKRVFMIFTDDIKHLLKNPIAIIVTIGLIILPSLYAWFNILSNWDPYGNTGNLTIAVANNDAGVSVGEVVNYNELPNGDKLAVDQNETVMNIGDNFVNNLRENDKINWVFVDYDDAMNGVENGTYYAAIVVPENFTRDFFSFLNKDITHPKLEYHVNAKKNAIATKITDSVMNSVKTEVNESFINTVTEVFGIAMNDAAVELDDAKDQTIQSNLNTFRLLQEQLNNLTDTTKVLNSTFVAAQALVQSSQATLPGIEKDLDSLDGKGWDAAQLAAAGKNLAYVGSTTLDTTFSNLDNTLEVLEKQISVTQGAISDAQKLELLDEAQKIVNENLTMVNKTETLVKEMPYLTDEQKTALLEHLDKVKKLDEQLLVDIPELESDLRGYGKFTEKNFNKLKADMDSTVWAAEDLHNYYKDKVAPTLNKNLDSLIDASVNSPEVITRLKSMITPLDAALSSLDILLGNQLDTYDSVQRILEHSQKQVQECIDLLEKGEQLGQENYLYNLMTNDPQTLASFISSPTEVETITMYPIENYGSAMAPFYTVLCLWVGALILAAIVNVNITNPAFKEFKLWQQYFGRSMTFSLMGILQALVASLGDIYLLHIQCLSPLKFVLICVACSYTFCKIVYTLTIALDDVGKAIAVVLLVMQVAGSGGTFPSEVMPKFFQVINSVLPFRFGLAATRECIAGMYGDIYWKNVLLELAYVPPCIIIGLLTWKKLYKAKSYFRRKMEETGIM